MYLHMTYLLLLHSSVLCREVRRLSDVCCFGLQGEQADAAATGLAGGENQDLHHSHHLPRLL